MPQPASFYSRTCHQLPERSFVVGEAQLLLCARCVGFYGAIFITSLVLMLLPHRPRLPLLWALILIIPGAVDALLDLSSTVNAANLIRCCTGFAAGLGVTAYLYPRYLAIISR